ncbi:hypothetical protein FHG87_014123 [Trinorchestia longiramus]|nr:hypothetical protein FHG87_014123 [Trinorchestia longiramus]
MEALRSEWDAASSGFCSAEVADKWWNTITEKYTADDRKFHNQDYLSRTFCVFHENKDKLRNPQAVAMAIFFQKLEYNPQSGDGEAACIEKFKIFLEEAAVDQDENETAKSVLELLECCRTNLTEEHMTAGSCGTEDRHYLLDLLVALLGASPSQYESYTASIQAEYSHLSDTAYKQLRLKILQSLLLIPNVYATKDFQERYEKQARENISREVKELKQSQEN